MSWVHPLRPGTWGPPEWSGLGRVPAAPPASATRNAEVRSIAIPQRPATSESVGLFGNSQATAKRLGLLRKKLSTEGNQDRARSTWRAARRPLLSAASTVPVSSPTASPAKKSVRPSGRDNDRPAFAAPALT